MRVFEIKGSPRVLLERNAINNDQPYGGQDAISQLIQTLQGRANTDSARKWLASALRRYLVERHPDVTDVTDQVVQAVAAQRWTGLPPWMKKDPAKLLQRLQGGEQIFVVNLSQEFRNALTGLVDYLNSLGDRNLARLSAEDAFQHAEQWHADIAVRAKKQAVDAQEDWANVHPVMHWPDGYEMVRLTSEKALDYESDRLNHCVGRGGYDKGVREGTIFIYSLRNEANQPFVSLEVNPATKEVKQIKSTANGAPPDTVWSHIKDFILQSGLVVAGDGKNVGLKNFAGLWFEPEAFDEGRGQEVMRFGDGTTVEKLDAFGAASGTLNAVMTLVRDGEPLTMFGVQAGKVISFSQTAAEHAKHLRAAIRHLNIPITQNGESIGLYKIGGAYFSPEDTRKGQEIAKIGNYSLVALKPFSGQADSQNAAYSVPLSDTEAAFIGVQQNKITHVDPQGLPGPALLEALRHIDVPISDTLRTLKVETGLRNIRGIWFEPPTEEDRFDQLGDSLVVIAHEFNTVKPHDLKYYLIGPQTNQPWLMIVNDNVVIRTAHGGSGGDYGNSPLPGRTPEMWDFFKRHGWGVRDREGVANSYKFMSESYNIGGWLFDPDGDYETVSEYGPVAFRRLLGYDETSGSKRDFEAYAITHGNGLRQERACIAVERGAITEASNTFAYKTEIRSFLLDQKLKVRATDLATSFGMSRIGEHYYHAFPDAVAGGEPERLLQTWLHDVITMASYAYTGHTAYRTEWFDNMTPEAGKVLIDWLGGHYLINPMVASNTNTSRGERTSVAWGDHKLYAYSRDLPMHLRRVLHAVRELPEMAEQAKEVMRSFFAMVARSDEVMAFSSLTMKQSGEPDDWISLFDLLGLDLVRLLGTGNLQRGRNALPILQAALAEGVVSQGADEIGSILIHYLHDAPFDHLKDFTQPKWGLFDASLYPEVSRMTREVLTRSIQDKADEGAVVALVDRREGEKLQAILGPLGIDLAEIMAGVDRSAFDDVADSLEDVLQETEDLLEATGDQPFEFELHNIKENFFSVLGRLLPDPDGNGLLTPTQSQRVIEMVRDSLTRWLDGLAADPFPVCLTDMDERNAFEQVCKATGLMPRLDEVRKTMEAAMKPLLDKRHKEAIEEKLDKEAEDIWFADGFEPDNKDIHNDALRAALKAMGIEYRSFDRDLEEAIDAAVEEWIDDQGHVNLDDWGGIDDHPPEVSLDRDDDDDDDDDDYDDDEDEDDDEEPARTLPDFDFATFWKEYAKAAYQAFEKQETDYSDYQCDDWKRDKLSEIEDDLKEDYEQAEQYIDHVLDYQLGWHELDRIKKDPYYDHTGRPVRPPAQRQLPLGR